MGVQVTFQGETGRLARTPEGDYVVALDRSDAKGQGIEIPVDDPSGLVLVAPARFTGIPPRQ